MRKISLLMKGVAVVSFGIWMTQCSGDKNSVPADKQAEAASEQPAGLKIAYVEVDSLLSQYQLSKELNEAMMKKEENIRATVNKKSNDLQNQVNEFQRKLENNAFLSEERARQEQDRLVKVQQNLQELQGRLASELQSETQKNTLMLRDSIRNFMNDYNKTHKYSMIVSNAGFDNLLYADSTLNITVDIVKGLNARYKKSSK